MSASAALLAAVLALTLLAAGLRLTGLIGPDGYLSKDEVKLALAADGVLRDGVPVLPSGRLFTRGMLNSYLIAPSFGLLGRHDFAARLPSAVAGTLLVPSVFLLGRRLGGAAAGLAAGAFIALAYPLVVWSRSAWMPSVFVLLFTLSVYGCDRGFIERHPRWQVVGAASFCLAVLSYELAILLPVGLGLYLGSCLVRRDHGWYRGRLTLLAFGLLAIGVALFIALTVVSTAGTLTGPLGLARFYVTPSLSRNGLLYYLTEVFGDYRSLFFVSAAGLPLVALRQPGRTLYLVSLIAVAFLILGIVIRTKSQERYALFILPLLATVTAASTTHLAHFVGRRLGLTGPPRSALIGLGLLVVFGGALSTDRGSAPRIPSEFGDGPTWLEVFQQQNPLPTDLILTEGPEVSLFYLGRVDFHIYTGNDGYELYSYQGSDTLRSIFADSALIRQPGDFERLVEAPNAGRSLWVLGHERRLETMADEVDPALWPSLRRSAERISRAPDGWILLKLRLPRYNVAAGPAP